MKFFRSLLCLALITLPLTLHAQENLTRLLRFPDIHGDMITFVYGGDIWVVHADGGQARRLTSHEGLELFPKFSPDGRFIAFTGQYSGTRQVHVIPVDGGEPRQLTFYNDVGELAPRGGIDNQVLDWTPDGTGVLFLAHRLPWGDRMRRHHVVPFVGGMEQPLPMPEGSGGMFSPDGRHVVYTPISREYRTWKRYRGGRAQDVWTFDLENLTARQITDHEATDNLPVWVGDKIYFTSDREWTLNLYSWDTATGELEKVTNHDTWDVLWPSAGRDRIVYEAGGYIWRYDPATRENLRVPIRVQGDFGNRVPYFRDAKDDIQSSSISPTGTRAVIEARGEIFTAPVEKGEIRNLTRTPGVREHSPAWSPDGRTIAYLSDRSGEYEIYLRNADGSGEERPLTSNGTIWRWAPRWSPDGRRIAFGDRDAKLRILDVASGAITDVDTGRFSDITNYQWSPDSRWLTWTNQGANTLPSVWVYSLDRRTKHRLTGEETAEASPLFDPRGRYIYFLSNRDFNLAFSGFEFTFVYTDPTRVYVGILQKDGPALFLPESDEEPVEMPDTPEPAPPAPAPAAPVRVEIDFDGFEQRVRAIPGPPGNYANLAANAKGVFYTRGTGAEAAVRFFDLDAAKEETIIPAGVSFELSRNGEKLLYRQGTNLGIVPATPGQKIGDGKIAVERLQTRVVPDLEWRQQFVDAWRILRDFFYDPGMHGMDWDAMRAKYQELVPHIAHRTDLDYILGELGGELNAGHVYVQTNDEWQIERREGGLLGAEIEADPSGYFRITKIFPGENWHTNFRSPLTEPGVNVNEGDYILAVDGVSTRGVANFYELMQNKGDRIVSLLVSSTPSTQGAHTEKIRPIIKETNLRYLDWVESRRRYVDEKSGGRIGYMHLPNTAVEGNRELFRNFYPQANKPALVIDVRYNGGGFIPDTMIGLLERPILSYWVRRNIEPFATPGFAHTGPKVTLINGYSSSGGDAFPYYFRQRGLGPLIGTRTWGGLIGISGNPSLMDGGQVLVPTFRFLDPEGFWAVEGEGVSPDIEVVDRPDLVIRGVDPSLDKAIEVLLDELERNPPPELIIPPAPRERRP
jgi:tricorn protease